MRDHQFYITLPSNSSMVYYPQNTVANYITHLSRQIELEGEWEVAVVEVHYPCSFLTLGENSVIYCYGHVKKSSNNEEDKVTNDPKPDEEIFPGFTCTSGCKPEPIERPTMEVAIIPPGHYNQEEEVVDMINSHSTLKKYVTVKFDKQSKRVEIDTTKEVDQIEMSHKLALQLGFDPNDGDLKKNNKSIRPANLHLGLPSQMYIYCDIVEPQFIGDTMAPLLQIVNIDTEKYVYGAHKHVQFNSPHYVSVLKASFESLEIDLRDDTGNHLPFQFGTSCVKLHFRKRG